jgi:hypothetical protein
LVYRRIELLNPRAPVVSHVGTWRHGCEVSPLFAKLPVALARIGLLPASWLVHNPLRSTS